MILYIGYEDEDWLSNLTEKIIEVHHVPDVEEFLKANLQIDAYNYLIVEASELLCGNEIDHFFFREYTRAPQLIILTQILYH